MAADQFKKQFKPMGVEDLRKAINFEVEQALSFSESELSQDRIDAQRYYNGGTRLKSIKGRSSVVVTKVRDTVRQMLPSIIGIFLQSGRPVEFAPKTAEDSQMVRDQNDAVEDIFWNSDGYTMLIEAIMDALNKGTGIVKIGYDEEVLKVHTERGLMDDTEIMDLEDRGYEITEMEPVETDEDSDVEGLYDVIATREVKRGQWQLDTIPPEEFIIDKYARCFDDAQICGTYCNKRVSDLVAMGFSLKDIGEADYDSSRFQTEKESRQGYTRDEETEDEVNVDPSARLVAVADIYMRIDADGDGYAELRHFITVGTDNRILLDEPVNFIPFADFRADIEPHAFFPQSVNKTARQDQDAQTALLRSILDNAALTNNPRTVLNDQYVNIEDAKSNVIGNIIRTKRMGEIDELATPFVAGQTLSVLQYLETVGEKRTGLVNAFQATDPDSIQSTSRRGVEAMIRGGQSMTQMIARNLSQGLMKVFQLIQKTIIAEGLERIEVPSPTGFRVVKTEMWHAATNYRINVGIGTGQPEEKIAMLNSMAQRQEAMVMQAGVMNPLCTYENLRQNYIEQLRLAGYKNGELFFPRPTPEILKQVDQMQKQQQQGQQDGAAQAQAFVQAEKYKADVRAKTDIANARAKAQIDVIKAQAEAGNKQAEMALERWKEVLADDRERDQAAMEFALKEFDLENKYMVEMDKNELNAEVQRDRNTQMNGSNNANTGTQ
jgi:hypothetical protein